MIFHGISERIWRGLRHDTIPDDVKWNTFAMRTVGMWLTQSDSLVYRIYVIVLFIFVYIVFPVTQILNIYAATSIPECIGCLFQSLTHFAIGMRTGIFYMQQRNIRRLFQIYTEMTNVEFYESCLYRQMAAFNKKLSIFYVSLDTSAWFSIVQQLIWTGETLAWPSTTNLPYAFGRRRDVYWAVAILQAWTNFVIVLVVAFQDGFVVALINMTCSHIELLKIRLENLFDSKDSQYADLVECCRSYEKLLRFDIHNSPHSFFFYLFFCFLQLL